MIVEGQTKLRIADRVWIATALLHQDFPAAFAFKKSAIFEKLKAEGLAEGVERGTLSAHLDQHCVANVSPSTGKYRMLFEVSPGNLRLFCPKDLTHPARVQLRKPSKSVPERDSIPSQYWHLLEWYEVWSKGGVNVAAVSSWEDDPLIRLIGSGRHVWADEHADEYVNRLREEEFE